MKTGVINLLKPPGMTSHDAVSFVRRAYGQKQVGHAGTLDPAAAGVLPIFLGRATRLVEYMADDDKEYRAELCFGRETDTGDHTGNVIRTSTVIPDRETILRVLDSFLGESEQIPPMYSAIKIGGKKLYDLARQGVTLERTARKISISSISLVRMKEAAICFDVTCSKGTYIRTLCEDIGKRCGTAAFMAFLLRTRVGCFSLANALSLEEITQDPAAALLAADSVLINLPSIFLSAVNTTRFTTGQKTSVNELDQSAVKVYGSDHQFIGIGRLSSSLLIPEKVFPPDTAKTEEYL